MECFLQLLKQVKFDPNSMQELNQFYGNQHVSGMLSIILLCCVYSDGAEELLLLSVLCQIILH